MPRLADADLRKILATNAHVGDKNLSEHMRPYAYTRNAQGSVIFNVQKIWDKLYLAARAIVAVPTEGDVCAVSASAEAQRPVLKFGQHTNALSIVNKFTAGTFTNYITKRFVEPEILIAADPLVDHRAISESSFVNIPVIAFCNSNASLKHVDIAIPCNTTSKEAVALMWWFLTREVLKLRGKIDLKVEWTEMVDMFITRTPEEMERLSKMQDSERTATTATAAEEQNRVDAAVSAHDTSVVATA